MRQVIVCPPEQVYFEVPDLVVHNITAPAERDLAIAQHQALCAALTAFGALVIALPELENHPNCVFTQDTAVSTPDGFIRLRLGLESRRGEAGWMADTLLDLGVPEVGAIEAPGTVEGGDVILAGDVAFVGHSSRTNIAGINQLRVLLENMGYEVRVLSVLEPSLHIGGVMSVIGPQHILACEGIFPTDFFLGFEVILVSPQDFISGNVITLGDGHIIAGQSNVHASEALTQAGFEVQLLDMSEFVKGTGGPSCLIMPLTRG